MKNERVAVLDIRSYEVTFLIGGSGINNTFIICGSKSEKYEGYSTEGFLDLQSLKNAIISTVGSVSQNYEGRIEEIYVSVPSPFMFVKTKGHTISFPSKRKLSAQDVDALYVSGQNELMQNGRCIRHSAMYFALGDNRKYFDAESLFGVPTSSLKGALCYYFISEEFYSLVNSVLSGLGIERVKFIPSSLAQACYLMSEKMREGYAFLLDVGYLTSTISVVYGSGIVREENFDCGLGQIIAALMEQLNIEYALAEEMLSFANVSTGNVPKDDVWTGDDGITYSVRLINDIIKCGLDVLCEKVDDFLAKYYKDRTMSRFSSNPLMVTGEALTGFAGATEHLSKRLNRLTSVAYPELPYYDKPQFSSRISLLSMAISDKGKNGLWNKLLNILGGKKRNGKL